MTDLTPLIDRVRSGEGPDQSLDSDIMWALGEWENLGGWWRKHKVTGQKEGFTYQPAPALTSDLNAVLALIGEKLPGWGWQVGPFAKMRAQIAEPIVTEFGPAIGIRADETGTNPARALLAATLSALQAQGEKP